MTYASAVALRMFIAAVACTLAAAPTQADVALISTGKAKNAVTGDSIPFVDGRTVPIKFRIEQGAVLWSRTGRECDDCVEQVVE